jgi:hypothetical protein
MATSRKIKVFDYSSGRPSLNAEDIVYERENEDDGKPYSLFQANVHLNKETGVLEIFITNVGQ